MNNSKLNSPRFVYERPKGPVQTTLQLHTGASPTRRFIQPSKRFALSSQQPTSSPLTSKPATSHSTGTQSIISTTATASGTSPTASPSKELQEELARLRKQHHSMSLELASANARTAKALLRREVILRQLRYMVTRYPDQQPERIVSQLRALLNDEDYKPASSLQCTLWEESVALILHETPPKMIDLDSEEEEEVSPTQQSNSQPCRNCGERLCLCPNKSYI